MAAVPEPSDDRLDSWKEIAAYLKRGVRTVRRWEREEGLPVHRHLHHVLGSVYAYKSEIDAWRETARRGARPARPAGRRDGAVNRIMSIAVLPFTNVSPDPENEYLADGFTDEVTIDLSRIATLRVISRTSAMTCKGTNKPATAIARELGVCYILEGTVRRAGDRLRITVQLIDAERDQHVWADKYEGPVTDIFAIQERIARVIVQALELQLTAAEDRRLADRSIADVHAYECYLRARQEAWRWRKDAIDHAVQLLHNGLDLVGPNARLYAAMGHAHLQYREAAIDLSAHPLDAAEGCVRKVLALEPRSASGLQLRGWIHYSRGEIQDAVDDLKAALEIEPNNADTILLLTNCYLISGRVPAARPLIDRLLVLDPLTPVSRCMRAFADAMEGNLAAAVEPYRQMYEMDPGNPMARLFYVWALALNGRHDAIAPILATVPPEVQQTIPARIACFLGHAAAGDAAAAHASVTEDIAPIATAADVFPRLLAQGYALAGMPDRAIEWLAIAVERGFVNYPFLAHHDPFFAACRGLPEFQRILDVVRSRWERFSP
jgi:TolB-like protein/thioredoxin-like negative regulator of GroEL